MTISIDSAAVGHLIENQGQDQILKPLAQESDENQTRISRHPRLHELTRVVDFDQQPDRREASKINLKGIKKRALFFIAAFFRAAAQLRRSPSIGAK